VVVNKLEYESVHLVNGKVKVIWIMLKKK